jgi:hypothetical protein
MTVNDYTPRYSEMRSAYALARTEFGEVSYDEAVAEFDRGLTQYESVLTRENKELREKLELRTELNNITVSGLRVALDEALAHLNEDTSLVEDALAEEEHVRSEEEFYGSEVWR